jgi:hypothetical protein
MKIMIKEVTMTVKVTAMGSMAIEIGNMGRLSF